MAVIKRRTQVEGTDSGKTGKVGRILEKRKREQRGGKKGLPD